MPVLINAGAKNANPKQMQALICNVKKKWAHMKSWGQSKGSGKLKFGKKEDNIDL